MKKLTKKQIDEYCKTVIYHLIDVYDTDAFCDSDLSLEDQYRIMDRMKHYASKYITSHIRGNTTNTILNSVRRSIK